MSFINNVRCEICGTPENVVGQSLLGAYVISLCTHHTNRWQKWLKENYSDHLEKVYMFHRNRDYVTSQEIKDYLELETKSVKIAKEWIKSEINNW